MKGISKMEKDGYILIDNPDLVNEYKILLSDYRIGSGDKAIFFGELQSYGDLKVDGELMILIGTPYQYTLNSSITTNTTLYGPVNIDGTINIGATLTIL